MDWMILPLRRYAEFRGRSRRREYWLFALFALVVMVVLSIVDAALGLGGSASRFVDPSATGFAAGATASGGLLSGLFSLAILVPSIALSVRRLHDIDRSGWWLVAVYGAVIVGALLSTMWSIGGFGLLAASGGALLLLGSVGSLVLLVFACMDGSRGPNRYGSDPKGRAGGADAAGGR